MTNYTQGGLADVAQHLAQKGRHGDTQLVHMSPKEVRGLQALATANGTSLTTNPTTGLPEAFRLENLIPMAAGAALSPFITPIGAAALVGGAYGAATGSIEKGLMAGIGAYGGAGITEGLTSAATQGATEASAANALGVPASAGPVATGAGSQASTLAAQNASMGLTPMESAANISSSAGYASGATPMSMGSQAVDLGSSGVGNLGTKEGLTAAYKGMPMGTLPATGISLLTAAQQPSSVPGYQETESERRLKGYRLSPNYQAYQAPTPNPYYRPTYAADGGVMGSFDDEPGEDMAHGGIASLGGYSDGGRMLRGPGDGMSDSIPGVIGGRQPARLADGEFVVPADVVSHLGNGSTEAGAKKLYGMMDKIRQARTGKKKQAPEIKADRYLPMKKMASGGITSYAEGGMTDSAVASYIQSSLDSGKGGAEIAAGLIAAGVPQSQVVAATGLSADVVAQAYAGGAALGGGSSGANVTSGGGSTVTSNPASNVPDSVIKASVIDMMNSGVGGAEIARAFAAMGVSQEQAVRATGLDANTIAQAYAGGASLPAISSAANLPLRLPVDASGKTIYPTVSDIRVASFIRDNQLTTPEQQAAAFKMYNIQPNQQAAALALLASKDEAVINSLNAATKEYQDAIKANPNLAIQNAYTTYYAAQDAGLKPIIPPIIPKIPTTPTKSTTPTNYPLYKQGFVPRVSGINVSDAMKDPFSNAGLEALYSQMMGQYQKPTPPMSDAQVKSMVQRLVNEKVGGAEIGQLAINAGIPVNQAITATGLSPEIVNQAYLGGQYLGTTPPPTLNTLYNYRAPALDYRAPPVSNLILGTPISDAARPAPEPAPSLISSAPVGDSGGGG